MCKLFVNPFVLFVFNEFVDSRLVNLWLTRHYH